MEEGRTDQGKARNGPKERCGRSPLAGTRARVHGLFHIFLSFLFLLGIRAHSRSFLLPHLRLELLERAALPFPYREDHIEDLHLALPCREPRRFLHEMAQSGRCDIHRHPLVHNGGDLLHRAKDPPGEDQYRPCRRKICRYPPRALPPRAYDPRDRKAQEAVQGSRPRLA